MLVRSHRHLSPRLIACQESSFPLTTPLAPFTHREDLLEILFSIDDPLALLTRLLKKPIVSLADRFHLLDQRFL